MPEGGDAPPAGSTGLTACCIGAAGLAGTVLRGDAADCPAGTVAEFGDWPGEPPAGTGVLSGMRGVLAAGGGATLAGGAACTAVVGGMGRP